MLGSIERAAKLTPLLGDNIKGGRCHFDFDYGAWFPRFIMNCVTCGEGPIIDVLANTSQFPGLGACGIVPYVMALSAKIRAEGVANVDILFL